MNLLDWLLVVLVARLRPLRLLAGLRHRRLRDRRAAARRPARHLAGPDRPRRRRPRRCWVSLGALFIVILSRLARPGAAPVRRRADPRPDHLAAGPGPRRRRRRRAQRGRRAAGRLGARASRSRAPGSAAITPLVRDSTVLAEVNEALPTSAGQALAGLQRRRRHQFFPRYLEPFAPRADRRGRPGPPRLLTRPRRRSTPRPSVAQGPRRPTAAAAASRAPASSTPPDRLMTNAHVVAGVDRPRGRSSATTRSTPQVVYYNPDLDVAVLARRRPATARTCASTSTAEPRRRRRGPRLPRRTARTTCSRRGSAPSSGCARPTSTATARCIREVYSLRGTDPAGQLRRPDRLLRRRRPRRGLRGVGHRRRHRLRADRRPGRASAAAAGVTADGEVGTGDCAVAEPACASTGAAGSGRPLEGLLGSPCAWCDRALGRARPS